MPGDAHLVWEHTEVSLVIIHKALFLWIPSDFAIQAHRDLAKVTQSVQISSLSAGTGRANQACTWGELRRLQPKMEAEKLTDAPRYVSVAND